MRKNRTVKAQIQMTALTIISFFKLNGVVVIGAPTSSGNLLDIFVVICQCIGNVIYPQRLDKIHFVIMG